MSETADTGTRVISLPMVSDTARCEASFLKDAASRIVGELEAIELAAQDGQRRIRAAESYIRDLDRYGSIDQSAAQEILRLLLGPDEFYGKSKP